VPPDLGRLPRRCLSTSKLTDVQEFRPRDLTITVGAGMRLSALSRLLDEERVWLPVDGREMDRTVGGWVAAAPTGPFDGSFGPVRRHVIACDLLLWDGRSTSWGRPVMKNVAGYDVVKLVCGSRARLGVLSNVTLRLWPRPRAFRRFELKCGSMLPTVTESEGAPRLEAVRWKGRATGSAPAIADVALTGAAASVTRRARALESWAIDRGISLTADESPPIPGRPGPALVSRPATSAAYRITFGRRYLAAGLKDLERRLSHVADAWELEAFPETGVVRLQAEHLKAAGDRQAPAWLTTLPEAVGKPQAAEPALQAPLVRIERGGEAEHEAARRLRSAGSRDIEARWVAAFGGIEVPWQADYL